MSGNIWKDDPLGKSLDWFINEWNEIATQKRKQDRQKILAWGRGE